jgi:iron complex transport system substrate-binding protein
LCAPTKEFEVKTKAKITVVIVLSVLATACGSGADDSSNSAETTEASETTQAPDTTVAPETTAAPATEDSMEEFPQAILSLSPTATEMLFAIGAGDQVIAVDSLSNYPAQAPTTDLSAFEPNLEAIAAYGPDLVVLSYDPGEVVAGLEAAGIKTILQSSATNLEEVYAQIANLGIATGQIDGAAATNAEIQAGIDAAVANAPETGEPIRVYHEIDATFYSATSSTFIGQMYELLGMANVADAADADGSNFGFPQLSPEYLIEADPQMIVITNQAGYDATEVSERPGWTIISAVQNGNIVQVDADIVSRWGPRIVQFLEEISAAVADALVSQ